MRSDSILINGEETPINEKIFIALKIFLNSDNQIISKEKLMQALWRDMIVSDDSLFKIIQELRRFLKTHNLSDSIIVNVYGKGYKIAPIIKKHTINKNCHSIKANNSETKKANQHNKTFKTLTIVAIVMSGLLIIIATYWYNTGASEIINLQEYENMRKLIKDNQKKAKLKIKKYQEMDKLTQSDKAKISYFQGRILINTGDFNESIKFFQQAIAFDNDSKKSRVVGDSYNLLAWIHSYKNTPELMKKYIDQAMIRYKNIDAKKRLLYMQISLGRYYSTIKQNEKAIEQFKKTAKIAINDKDTDALMRSYTNLANIYEVQENYPQTLFYAQKALEIAQDESNATMITFAYGQISSIKMKQAEYKDAMKYIIKAIRHSINQADNTIFQQIYSYFYNILSRLGHDILAEKYITIAINFQNKKNSDGHLNKAETNLGILYLKTMRYKEAQDIFEQLLGYDGLIDAEIRNVSAWLSLTRYFLHDNISAYTLSKSVYNDIKSNNKSKIIAGITLASSALEIERENESIKIFEEIKDINKDVYILEKSFYLELSLELSFIENLDIYNNLLQEKIIFDKYLQDLKEETQPEELFLQDLDDYIAINSLPQ
jgi:DNA-binding winged helix-turn-helix (wHTH) protein/TPR repeat protein